MSAATAINTYANIGIETSVSSADPHKLILLLYQGALLSISTAKNQILRKDIPAKGKSISQAITIIEEGLKASLDRSVGGDLARNLSDLYEYMIQRLLIANLKNDVSVLDEVSHLLSDLKGAWEQIRPAATVTRTQAAEPPPPTKPAALTYGRT